MWVLQQIVLQGFKLGGFFVAQYAWDKAGNRVDQYHGTQFSAGEHVISDGNVVCDHFLQHSFVNSLVVAAQQDQIFFHGKFFHHRLIQHPALGRQIDRSCGFSNLFFHRLAGTVYRLRLHNHSGAAAVGIIVHPIVFVGGKIPDIRGLQSDAAFFHRFAQDAGVQSLLDHLRKQCQYMKIHSHLRLLRSIRAVNGSSSSSVQHPRPGYSREWQAQAPLRVPPSL